MAGRVPQLLRTACSSGLLVPTRLISSDINLDRAPWRYEILPEQLGYFVNGQWQQTQQLFDVSNPADGKLIAAVPNCGVANFSEGVAAARGSFPKWSMQTSAKEREVLLRRWYDLMVQHSDALAQLLTWEQGKLLAESKGEIAYAAGFFDWFSSEARRIRGETIPTQQPMRTHLHEREPCGVVGIITPWNFPAAMITRKVGAALACGCTTVLKPAEDTPLTALAIAKLSVDAGIPAGVVNVVTADRANTALIGEAMCNSTDVDVISFTGSTNVGKILLRQSADTVKRVCLELGGNAPFLVFDSANIDTVIKNVLAAKFRVSGQTCVTPNRFIVQSGIHDQFVQALTKAVPQMAQPCFGPLINKAAVDKVHHLVSETVQAGAQLVLGGKQDSKGGYFYPPTLVTGVTQDMPLFKQEQFGPVIAVTKFDTEEEGVSLANNVRVGLAGYMFSRKAQQIKRVSRQLQVGMLGVNEAVISTPECAFGGVKESGLGREGGSQGIDEFTNWKYLCIHADD